MKVFSQQGSDDTSMNARFDGLPPFRLKTNYTCLALHKRENAFWQHQCIVDRAESGSMGGARVVTIV